MTLLLRQYRKGFGRKNQLDFIHILKAVVLKITLEESFSSTYKVKGCLGRNKPVFLKSASLMHFWHYRMVY